MEVCLISMLMESVSLMGLLINISGALPLQVERVTQDAHVHVVHRMQTHLLEMTTFVNQEILVHLYNEGCTQNHFGMDRGVEVERHPAVMLPAYHGSIRGSVLLPPTSLS